MNFAGDFDLMEKQILVGHTDRVWSLAWKPATGVDGIPAVLASCSGDKTVRIWEQSPATGSFQCKVLSPSLSIFSLGFASEIFFLINVTR